MILIHQHSIFHDIHHWRPLVHACFRALKSCDASTNTLLTALTVFGGPWLSRDWPQLTNEFWIKRAYTGGLNDLMTENFESWACFQGHPCLAIFDTFVTSPPSPSERVWRFGSTVRQESLRDAMNVESSRTEDLFAVAKTGNSIARA